MLLHRGRSAGTILTKGALLLTLAALAATASSSAVAAQSEDPEAPDGTAYRFAIVRVLDDPFFNSVHQGAQQQAATLGADITVDLVGPSQVDAAEQDAGFRSLIAAGYDGIAVAPVDATAIMGAINQATEAGIPVVVYNLDVADPSAVFSRILTDVAPGAEAAGEAMCEVMGNQGDLYLAQTGVGNVVLEQRWDGFTTGLARNCPDVGVQTQIVGCEVSEGTALVRSAIVANPDIRHFYADTQCTANSLVQAVEGAGIQPESVIYAYDATPVEVCWLLEDSVQLLIAQKGLEQGQLTMDALWAAVNGEEFPELIYTDTVTMTADNFDETSQWAYPAGGGQTQTCN